MCVLMCRDGHGLGHGCVCVLRVVFLCIEVIIVFITPVMRRVMGHNGRCECVLLVCLFYEAITPLITLMKRNVIMISTLVTPVMGLS